MLVVTGTQGGSHACVVPAHLFHFLQHPASSHLPGSQLCCLYLWRPLGSMDWCIPFLRHSRKTPFRQSTKSYAQSTLFSTPGSKPFSTNVRYPDNTAPNTHVSDNVISIAGKLVSLASCSAVTIPALPGRGPMTWDTCRRP